MRKSRLRILIVTLLCILLVSDEVKAYDGVLVLNETTIIRGLTRRKRTKGGRTLKGMLFWDVPS